MNNSLSKWLAKSTRKFGMYCSSHSAEICTGVAVVTSVAAVGFAVKATKDVLPELEHHKNNIDTIKSHKTENSYIQDKLVDKETMEITTTELTGKEAEKEYRKDIAKEYALTSLTVAKRYAIPVALEITAVATIISSNKISRKKNAALASSLTAVQAMYDKYRQNVIEAVGEDEERNIRLGLHKEKVETVDENGKKKKGEVLVADRDKKADAFAGLFCESSVYWQKPLGVNRDTLLLKQRYWNDILCTRKYVFVNEIFEDLDMPEACTELGQYCGWIYDDTDTMGYQNCIDFHMIDIHNGAKIAFLNGDERNIFIELKPDGYIADKLWPKNMKEIVADRARKMLK